MESLSGFSSYDVSVGRIYNGLLGYLGEKL